MRHNTIIDYKLKLHIITIHWRSIIDSWDPPNSFVDKQLIGPYKYWNHLHKISKLSDNQTIVEDVVDYKLPFGFIAYYKNNHILLLQVLGLQKDGLNLPLQQTTVEIAQ